LYEKKKEEERKKMMKSDFLAVCFWAPAYSTVCSQVFSWTARQYHSLCMLGLGSV